VIFTFPLPNPAGNTNDKHLLIATSTFTTHLPAVTPNYTTLPQNFFVPNADSVTIVFSAGPDTVTFMGSAIPKNGVDSLRDANIFAAPNLVTDTNSPTNFAGDTGSLNIPPPPPPTGDYNHDAVVDAADYTVWRNTLGQEVAMDGDGADGDADGIVDDGDYDFWKERFGDVIPPGGGSASSVPEPTALSLPIVGLLALVSATIRRRRARA
jgi:hypothetical protein